MAKYRYTATAYSTTATRIYEREYTHAVFARRGAGKSPVYLRGFCGSLEEAEELARKESSLTQDGRPYWRDVVIVPARATEVTPAPADEPTNPTPERTPEMSTTPDTTPTTQMTGDEKSGLLVYRGVAIVEWTPTTITLRKNSPWPSKTLFLMNQMSMRFTFGYIIYQAGGKWFAMYRGETIAFDGETLTFERRDPDKPRHDYQHYNLDLELTAKDAWEIASFIDVMHDESIDAAAARYLKNLNNGSDVYNAWNLLMVRDALYRRKNGPAFLICAPGYWAKGKTLEEAEAQFKKMHKRAIPVGSMVYKHEDPDVTVDSLGVARYKGDYEFWAIRKRGSWTFASGITTEDA